MKARSKKNEQKVILKEGRFLRFVKRGEWEFVERTNCSGAVIIIAVTDDRKIIFVEQHRPPINRNVIEFPAGLINDTRSKRKESLIQAAKRELLEETGYRAKKIKKILQGPASSGTSADMLTLVKAEGLSKVSKGGGDSFESIEVHEVPLNRVDVWLKKMERKGCFVGPRIYAGLYHLKKNKS